MNASSRILTETRSHDTGMKLCRLKIITFSTIHTAPVELYLLQLLFISLLKFARENVLHITVIKLLRLGVHTVV